MHFLIAFFRFFFSISLFAQRVKHRLDRFYLFPQASKRQRRSRARTFFYLAWVGVLCCSRVFFFVEKPKQHNTVKTTTETFFPLITNKLTASEICIERPLIISGRFFMTLLFPRFSSLLSMLFSRALGSVRVVCWSSVHRARVCAVWSGTFLKPQFIRFPKRCKTVFIL